MIAQHVRPVGIATKAAAGHCQIAPVKGHKRRGRKIKSRTQAPLPSVRQNRVVARVIVKCFVYVVLPDATKFVTAARFRWTVRNPTKARPG